MLRELLTFTKLINVSFSKIIIYIFMYATLTLHEINKIFPFQIFSLDKCFNIKKILVGTSFKASNPKFQMKLVFLCLFIKQFMLSS
jgi:hypothetical protein